MGDKGGKGYSVPKPRKSSLKTPLSNNGSAKSKHGVNVQFEADLNFSPRNGGKGESPMTNGKGGKGDKVANGGKKPEKKTPPPVQLRVEKDLPENVTCLTDCEAAEILEGIQEQMVVLSEDPTIKIPIFFDKGLQLAKRGSDSYTSPQAVREILQRLKNHGVADSEACMIANIHPESADEVFSLVPSLKGKKNKLRGPVESALGELAKLRRSA
ncbi:hypothetical protein DCAR_0935809 [Daucus carota subsp. sativus]|uniref:RNA polymerase Rpb4/RPC9 core domain-containing protein n=1 Tax=Daucus carota subsp. sativus TaxID=79200 RepID=A0AAF0Y0V6_DAUCS|nr:hypothetical protein DCAR_0935809 [Daucus carota subsp. sativus]